jgi:uncharacterized delta-60 repeat protein
MNAFTQLSAQQLWVNYISATVNPINKMVADPSGNVYVAGYNSNGGFLVKYFTTGQTEWQLSGLSFVSTIAIDNSSNIYLGGTALSNSNGQDYIVYKYDSSGVLLWSQTYDGIYHQDDGVTAICIDNSGNVYVTGISDSLMTSRSYCTLKYNSGGVLQWAKRYVNSMFNFNQATAIATDNSGNVYVTGNSNDPISTNWGFATVKYNSTGTQLWDVRYDGPNNTSIGSPCAIAIDPSGNIIVTGYSGNSSSGASNYATLKYNSSGVQQWVQLYNGVGNDDDEATALALDAAGNIYVTGFSYSSISDYDFVTVKYNNAGTQQWFVPYNGQSNNADKATAIALDAAGNVFVTGSSFDSLTNNDFATVKYSNNGNLSWNETFNTINNGSDIPSSIAVDQQGNTYVSGPAGSQYATIKYGIATGITETNSQISFSVYPNPSSGIFTIENLSNNSEMEIYNSLGQKIFQSEIENPKSEIDLSDQTNGIYFVKVKTGKEIFTEKIIIQK